MKQSEANKPNEANEGSETLIEARKGCEVEKYCFFDLEISQVYKVQT